MKAKDAITAADDLYPNQYTAEQKLRWLSTLDGQVFAEIIRNRVIEKGVAYKDTKSGNVYGDQSVEDPIMVNGDVTEESELLIPHPYCDDVYVPYLHARICQANNELTKWNNEVVLYNAGLDAWRNDYFRAHRSLPSRSWRI